MNTGKLDRKGISAYPDGASGVESVNGLSGDVILHADDIGVYSKSEINTMISEQINFADIPATKAISWEKNVNAGIAVYDFGYIQLDRYVYRIAGWTTGSTRTFQRFDLETQEVIDLPMIPTAVYYPGVAYIDGFIHCMGGRPVSGTAVSSQHCRFNIAAYEAGDTSIVWETLPAMPAPVTGAHVAAIGDIIYLVGGVAPASTLSLFVQRYNTVTGEWLTNIPLPEEYWSFNSNAVAIGDYIVVSGGSSNVAATVRMKTNFMFDTVNEIFIELGTCPGTRQPIVSIGNGLILQPITVDYASYHKFYLIDTNRRTTIPYSYSLNNTTGTEGFTAFYKNQIILGLGYSTGLSNALRYYDLKTLYPIGPVKKDDSLFSDAALLNLKDYSLTPPGEIIIVEDNDEFVIYVEDVSSGSIRRPETPSAWNNITAPVDNHYLRRLSTIPHPIWGHLYEEYWYVPDATTNTDLSSIGPPPFQIYSAIAIANNGASYVFNRQGVNDHRCEVVVSTEGLVSLLINGGLIGSDISVFLQYYSTENKEVTL